MAGPVAGRQVEQVGLPVVQQGEQQSSQGQSLEGKSLEQESLELAKATPRAGLVRIKRLPVPLLAQTKAAL